MTREATLATHERANFSACDARRNREIDPPTKIQESCSRHVVVVLSNGDQCATAAPHRLREVSK